MRGLMLDMLPLPLHSYSSLFRSLSVYFLAPTTSPSFRYCALDMSAPPLPFRPAL
jgi:hypothetical protein